ncbi:alkaline phosphatase [Sphingomonas sp. Leaf407]|uniref:alkaline phosphatase family protein n=1 Tax=unclassified Sphingomonas TaxID=196159 RepID=UPI000701BBD1|nr:MULTISPECIES: alkaline phosphatase family protein [unclassified Sphingomonas]KQN40277.1 alkaline phosphatase [Sphingomonas sp. Leaf42]KQT29631.1 alkaline phosphatase [Sphingomonas sp. Leaf407]
MRLVPLAAVLLATAAPALAQTAAPAAPLVDPVAVPPGYPATPPKLIVAISVDQFSADLFAEYRGRFTGGFTRLMQGAVFPAGYQSHAATETCPGHSTILTGSRPARTGIIANDWIDQKSGRADGKVYCAEDERIPGSTFDNYTVSDVHLKVPTLGERMKAADPRTRVVSVAGKDRAAVMMGGHKVDELWWFGKTGFVSYAGRAMPPVVARANAAVAKRIATAQVPLDLPDYCRPLARAVRVGDKTVGTGRFARAGGDIANFRRSPEYDAAVLALAAGLIQDMKLGQGPQTDIISIGASATDYVGHGYGTEGSEMCLQLTSLDQSLGAFFQILDATGVDYQVVLTADHGGSDASERLAAHAVPDAVRLDGELTVDGIGKAIGAKLGIAGPVLLGGVNGDVWYDVKLGAAQKAAVEREAIARFAAHPQTQAVFTRAQILATPMPQHTPPETWSLLERARASYNPERSGDLLVAMKPRVLTVPHPVAGTSVATHGSFWDYDRRVPILFWRKGAGGFEEPFGVETVDILPTLAATIGLRVPANEIDGRCLDLDPGEPSICR